MLPFYKEVYGNPSSLYSLGRDAKTALEEARARTAGCLGANANEIYFTSCGSESDNWAVKGAARAQRKKGKNHIITSAFEHHAVDVYKRQGPRWAQRTPRWTSSRR